MRATSLIAFAISGLLTLVHALPAAPAGQIPYAFYSLEYQDNYVKNLANIQGKPYAKYFKPDLYVYPEMIEPGRLAIDCGSQAMNLSQVSELLVPASVQLPNENAWCTYSTGAGYVASRTHWPGVTGDMITWWFGWHSKESARYSLWHPWGHVSISSSCAAILDDPTINNTAKYVGCTHHITEIIQEVQETIDIHFKPPSFYGLDESKFAANGIVASASGEIFFGTNSPIKAVDMIHLWYQTSTGLELRSRYFLGTNVRVDIPIVGQLIPFNDIANLLGIKNALIGRQLASDQFQHDQQEMTHLASILPALYKEYGNNSK